MSAACIWVLLAPSPAAASAPCVQMLGLDGAGKTTLLYKQAMCTRQGTAGVQTTIPTIGFYLETLE